MLLKLCNTLNIQTNQLCNRAKLKNLLQPKVIHIKAACLLIFIFLGFAVDCFCQQKPDSVHNSAWIIKVDSNKNVKKLMKFISREPKADPSPFNEKSEDAFLVYEGKIVRRIAVQHLGFENTVLDTAGNIKNFITRSANKLHVNTREFVIRNYLFVKEGKPYSEPDSTFAQYRYQTQDYWIGYSFGNRNSPKNLKENRNRKFIAVRAYEQYFLNSTNINLTEPDRYAYRNKGFLLAQLTFFRQDFYKTQYVVGFGRTEDIPYGYRISVTTGWEKEL